MLFLLSALSGALTIFSPCILPVIPFVMARGGRSFRSSTLPLLCGMAATFALVATLGSVTASWAVHLNTTGRILAIIGLGLLGLSLVSPAVAHWLNTPFVRLGQRFEPAPEARHASGLPREAHAAGGGTSTSSFLLGIATGFLWAPCAGPILGLVLAGAIWQGPNAQTSLLLLTYALGAAASLALVMTGGTRLMKHLRLPARVSAAMRRLIGFCVLAGAASAAVGLDIATLAPWSSQGVDALERHWLRGLPHALPARSGVPEASRVVRAKPVLTAFDSSEKRGQSAGFSTQFALATDAPELASYGLAPPIEGAVQWLNTAPLSPAELKGKVVLVNFWTFGCINCKNALPHVREWYRKYKDRGLVVIGVHSPEFAFEKNIDNVKEALIRLDVQFPVAVDNDFTIWRSFHNQYWPAVYLIDGAGHIRFEHFGEGAYMEAEAAIRQLLTESAKSRS